MTDMKLTQSDRLDIRHRLMMAGLMPVTSTSFSETNPETGRRYLVSVPDGGTAVIVADWISGSIVKFGKIDRPKTVEMSTEDSNLFLGGLPLFDGDAFIDAAIEAQRWQREVPS